MDLISRQALRDAMYHEAFETDTEMQRWDSGCWIRYKLFENVIDNLLSAERKGKWKVSNLPKGRKLKYCSECGFGQNMNDERIYNYCPNCGARMDERREDEK